MVRTLAALLAVASFGCTDGDAPPLIVTDAAVVLDMALGGEGAPCNTACDCTPGLACRNRTCRATAVMVFCCGSAECAGSALCEFSDGHISQCDRVDGGGVPPVVDGGAPPAMCMMTSCTPGPAGDVFCKLACGRDRATCVDTGGNANCVP
jgi:hypothetical protein